jgi:hypothetical protein
MDDRDRNATRPLAGTLWAWEPGEPTAAALIEVTRTWWNGEEWWVSARILAGPQAGGEYPNELGRFWEACHRVHARPGPGRGRGATRSGEPQPEELLGPAAVREGRRAGAAWLGLRITLGCGHMHLRDMPVPGSDEAGRRVIGEFDACYSCPVRKRRTGGQVSALRQIVNVETVTSSRSPKSLDPVHWYWEGEGD